MKHRINYLIPFILAIGFLFQQTATAQTYDIPNSVVGNGGETMSSSNYSVTGTTLPAPAALDLSSASFTQRSGFWAVYQATVDVTSPATPTGLTATPGNGQVVLTWTANSESDLTSYKVYGGTSASPTTLLSTITAGTETYTHTSLTNGTTYYYRITAVDNAGNESGYSSEVSAMPLFGVTSFVPNSGIAGTGVTIYGVGFSTTASNNTVKFGNVSATVSSSTSSILKVSVPSGVVGPVSVSVSTGGVTDTSATLFTIIPTRTDMTTFGSQQAITTLADDVTSVYSADLDGDGDLDVLSASDYDDKIAWYENTDGSGTFGSQQVITTLADGAFSVYSADLDGDGDMDVLSASYNDDKIAWYENTDGSGTFGTQQVITTLADYPMSIHSADLDGDGDMDVLSASQFDTKIAWYENTDGSGTFGSQQVITTLADGAYSVHSADLDGDGDMDVLSASVFDDKIAWYENTDGSGSFGSQQVITTLADGAVSVYAADLDGDGDMDVLSASESDDKIAWYENTDGSGTFGSQQVITTLTDAARSVHTADLDGDGDLDVLSASYYDDKIAWYENTDGSGSFGSQQVITTLADVAFSVHSADLDGDGDLDVLSASRGDDKIAWYENMDAPPATPTNLTATPGNAQITLKWNKNIESDFAKYIIYGGTSASPTTKIDSTTSISDTTKTITGLTNGTTYYYRISAVDNAGNESGYSNEVSATPGQFTRITSGDIANDEADTRGIAWGDYDNDGDLDLFVTNYLGENNFLYQNNGDGTFTKITTGSVVTDGGNSFGVSWGDYDNDGDLDVLVANDGVNFLYSNNGDGTFSKITTDPVVTDDGTSISCAWGDYDNDGDLDLFVANSNSQNNFLYQNNGDGTFTKITTGSVVTDGGDSYGSSWSDYDGDGDLDLFVANVSGQNNFLYQNDGDGTFTKVTTGSIVTDGGYSFGSSWGDYDNDGDLDMFVTNGSAENNFLYSNNGNGTFTKVTTGPVVTDGGNSHSCAWGDYDNDGDLDVFVGNISSNLKNFLYANNGNTNEWVNITCIGTVSNTSAIGAKVHVKATIDGNAVWQMRDISGQTGYGSQNSLNAEFGLGDATVIDSIKIEWPSGIVWDTTNVAVNQFLSINESGDLPIRAPSGLVATSGNTQITLKWNKNNETDFAKYIIYGGISTNPTTKVDSTTSLSDTTKTITGLTNGTTYYYRITVVDNAGNESGYSSEVSATPTKQKYTVKTDGTGDYTVIQTAIDATTNGDTVLVHPGTYVENINFNGKNIVVGSLFLTTQDTSYISSTIIDGNQNGSVVTFENGESLDANLIGFKIRNGLEISGGGISCDNSSPTLSNLIVDSNNSTGNHISTGGGGIACRNRSIPKLTNLIIMNNTADGRGGAIYLDYTLADIFLTNIVIIGNTSFIDGHAIYCYTASRPILTNVTMSNNKGSTGISFKCLAANSVKIYNSILWGNTIPELEIANQPAMQYLTVANSNIQNGQNGVNINDNTINWHVTNINENPNFLNINNTDFNISNYSPCIGAGTDSVQIDGTWHNAPTTDIDGNPRPNPAGSNPDMGAYENSRATPQIFSVASTSPSQNALNVSKTTSISVTFNDDVDPATINDSTFVVHSSQTGLHAGSYSYDNNDSTATFIPNQTFAVGEVVSVTLTTGIQTLGEIPLQEPHEWFFTIATDDGSGVFVANIDYTTGSEPSSVFSADLDGDGDMDMAVAYYGSDNISVLLNNGDGTFQAKTDYPAGGNSNSVYSADLDGDGDMDLMTANYNSGNISVLLNNGDGTFAAKTYYTTGDGPRSVYFADLDGDGDMDLATANSGSSTVSVLMNNGNGTFGTKTDYATGSYPYSVFSTDLDGDGDMDLATANGGSSTVSVLLNNGDGTFGAKTDYTTGTNPRSVYFADFDGDGDMDLAVVNRSSNTVSILLNNGDSVFQEKTDYATGSSPRSVYSADLDGDGDMDLMTANLGINAVSILFNNSDGTFAPKVDYTTGNYPQSIYSADFDGDGDMDAAVTNTSSNTVSILLNRNSAADIVVSSDSLEFGIVRIDSSVNLQFSVYNDGVEGTLEITDITSSNTVFTVDQASVSIAPGDTALFTVNFTPTAANAYSDSLTINSNDPHKPQVRIYIVGVGHGPVWHVDADANPFGDGSQEDPFNSIQTAIDATTNGDTVLVHPGTYVENINFNGKNIVVGSLFLTTQDTSYISSTIIDGNQNGSVVTFENGEDSTAVMSGFIIRNGATQQGGGIYCTNSSPNLSHLKIMSNTGSNIAGLFCYNNANPILRNSVITENSASNFGGGIHSEQNSSPIIENVIIKDNSADAGGGIFSRYDCSPKLINVMIIGNVASHYGGIYTYNSTLDLVNVTIAENVASNNSGIYGENSNLTITNSIILESINILYGGSITATYSNIQGGYTGTGNIDADPLFADTANNDYRLSDYSPAIGAGTDSVQINGTWYYAPNTDIDGNPRPNPTGSNPDMGAYENSRPSQRPKAGTVADGVTNDVDWHNSISSLSANWEPFTDNDTLTYEYAIGTSLNSLTDVLDWTSSGTDTFATKTGLTLTEGLTYYVSVRGTDVDGQISDTTTTDGITIDTTQPTITAVIEGSAASDTTVTDIDGNVYQTVLIGDQIWMKENLKTTHYQNGVEIPYLPNNDDWMNVSSGAYCVYDNNESNADTYGYLYSWYTVNDSNNAAPEGWHIPTDTEWTTLIDYLGGSNAAGSKLKESGTIHWNNPNTGSTNESGFTALPGGYRNHTNGSYSNIGSYGRFWSSTERNISDSWYRKLNYLNSEVYRDYYDKQRGLSIRCLKDNAVFTNGDADYQNSTDSLIVSWSGSDASSGLSNYEYALGTTSGGTETLGWTSTGTATADTVTGLTLTEGTTYYLSVRATDVAGNVSDVLTGDGIALDLTAPAGSIVHDGTTTDITFTGSDSTLSANWPAFTEDVSGIARYEVAIGSSSGGTEIVGWTNNTTDTIFTKTGLTLNSGTTYYVSVRATDLAWNVSTTITSDGVTVDTEGPIAGSVFDGDSSDMDWTNSDSSLSANWKNFSDPLSGINFYEYAIGTETDSFSLAGWTTTADTFFVESDLTLISSETYYVFVKATDYIGNTGNVSGSDGIMVDLIVPLVGELYDGADGDDIDWQSSDSTLSFYWSGSDSRELNYYQYSVGTAAGDSNVVDWTSVSTNTSVTIENLELIEEQTYYGNVRAVDRANNVSDVVSSDGITIDFTAPVTGIIIDGLEDDLVFTGTSDSLSAHWTGYSDSFSGIQFYEYAIGSTPQGSNVVDWTLNSTDTVMTKPGLSLMNGTMYYISVRATDFAGNVSNTGSTDGVTVDIEPPVAGNVFDGAADDEQWTNSFTTLEGNYSGFTDQISGLQFYEYAIGTTSGGTDVVDWMNNVLETSFFRDDFTLQSGTTYYISVRATDFVENTSTVATSNGITVDQFNPTVSEPLDGSLTEDIDWQQDNTMLMAAWQGNDTREIEFYEFSFGTTPGDSTTVPWTSVSTNTDVTVGGLSLINGTTYYVNVRAYDIAGNRSDVAVSDGITVDYEPPSIGEIHDGAGQDIWLSNSSGSVSANWYGFTDTLSGIVRYKFALGSSVGSNDIIDWTDNGMDSTVIDYTGLNLQHAATYYFSVRATDLVGNVSDVAASDGFVIDIYPGPPTFVSMTFDTSSELLSLIDDRVVDIVLSEPSVSMEYGLSSIIPVMHESELNNDSIQINLTAPFAGLDTLKFSISNLTDMVGLDSSYSFTIYTKTHADYNDDGMVDVSDLATFTTAWTSEDFNNELGPVTGTVPHLIPTPNNVFDLRDIMTFARMWHWSNNTPTLMLANLYQYGNEPDIQQSGKMLEIVLPDNTVSAQILVLYDQTKLEIENSIDLLNKNEILLKSHFKEEGNLLIEKAYLSDNQEKRISLETNSLDKEDSYISIQYIFLDQYKNTVAQGFISQKVIAVPDEFALHQNYPNPFNPVTTIQYDLPEDSHVELIIYDILGREVKILLNQPEQAGYKSVRWNGQNNAGQQTSAGMYFYRLETAGFVKVNKMILLK